MQFVRKHAETFADLFKGNPNAHGCHIPEKNPVNGKKAKGKSFLAKTPLTVDAYLEHLHGEKSIGVAPLLPDNTIWFAAIDVDVYPLDPMKYLTIIQRGRLPLIAFSSKSKGLHLYLFFKEPVLARKALPLIQEIRQMLGLPLDTEVFPKQTRLVGDSVGNWINLPYFDHSKTVRCAYNNQAEPMTLESAIKVCNNSRVTLKELKDIVNNTPISKGPPCLQSIYLEGGAEEGQRNVFLFNCAVYLKARFGDDYADNLHKLNKNMLSPIDYTRLDTTVIASHNRKDYTYQCKDAVLSGVCDKDLCRKREYGIASDGISDLSYEDLKQIRSSKPYYIWTVNGQEMVFYNESELMNQMKFRELCIRQLHTVPKKLTANAWEKVLNRALENLVVEEIDEFEDISTDSLWLSKVTEFFTRQKALRPIQIEDGLSYYQANKDRLHFKAAKLLDFLSESYSLRDFKSAKHRQLLKQLGAQPNGRLGIGKGKVLRSWYIKLKSIQNHKGLLLEVAVDDVPDEDNEPINFVEEEDKF